MTIKELEKELKLKKKMQNKRFNNVNVMDYLVIVCILSIQIFVIVALYYYYIKGISPTIELMQYFFAFFSGELLAMATITVTKNRKKEENNENRLEEQVK